MTGSSGHHSLFYPLIWRAKKLPFLTNKHGIGSASRYLTSRHFAGSQMECPRNPSRDDRLGEGWVDALARTENEPSVVIDEELIIPS